MACIGQKQRVAQLCPVYLLTDITILGYDDVTECVGQDKIAMCIGMHDVPIAESNISMVDKRLVVHIQYKTTLWLIFLTNLTG